MVRYEISHSLGKTASIDTNELNYIAPRQRQWLTCKILQLENLQAAPQLMKALPLVSLPNAPDTPVDRHLIVVTSPKTRATYNAVEYSTVIRIILFKYSLPEHTPS